MSEAVLEKMRATLKKRGAQGIRGLARNFMICDTDGSRALDVDELAKCCKMCRLGLSAAEVEALHSHFDADRNGKVVFDEFLRVVRGSMCPRRRKLVLKVFDLMDADRNGYLDVNDIGSAYSASEHPEVKDSKFKIRDLRCVDARMSREPRAHRR